VIKVRVPATSANLGPGFDCLGVALDLWNEFTVQPEGKRGDLIVVTEGEGAEILPKDDRNLLARTFAEQLLPHEFDHGFLITANNNVPCASGLGSSSTAVAGGVMLAAAMKGEFDRGRCVRRAVAIEGHGDNVGPAILGGLVLIVDDSDGLIVRKLSMEPVPVVVCVPKFDLLTNESRGLLPVDVTHRHAVLSVGRSMLVVQALQAHDYPLLERAMRDWLHEPYRMPKIPGAYQAKQNALDAGASAVCLSGAGPGLIAFAPEAHDGIAEAFEAGFAKAGVESRAWVLPTTDQGAELERLE
jgi:homoserine kinase